MTANLSVIINTCIIFISIHRSVLWGAGGRKYCSVGISYILGVLGVRRGFLGVDDGCIENDRRGLVYVRFGRCWQCVYAPTVLVVSE